MAICSYTAEPYHFLKDNTDMPSEIMYTHYSRGVMCIAFIKQ